MNIKITKEENERLSKWTTSEFIFGSYLYGTNSETSDKDILRIYIPDKFWYSFITTIEFKHCFQYDDVENNVQYVYVLYSQFMKLLYNGDNTIFSDILLFKDNVDLKKYKTYNIIKAYLGYAKRDLKHNTFKRIFHAERSLYTAECLLNNEQPLKGDIQGIYKNSRPKEYLILKENSLRKRLNEMLEKQIISRYYIPETKDELLNKLWKANNIIEFKYA